jgi:hypothetical protein
MNGHGRRDNRDNKIHDRNYEPYEQSIPISPAICERTGGQRPAPVRYACSPFQPSPRWRVSRVDRSSCPSEAQAWRKSPRFFCGKRPGDRHFQLDYGENLLYDYQNDQLCRRMPFIRVDVVSAGHLGHFSIGCCLSADAVYPHPSEQILFVHSHYQRSTSTSRNQQAGGNSYG